MEITLAKTILDLESKLVILMFKNVKIHIYP
jgi:hypothetical protein